MMRERERERSDHKSVNDSLIARLNYWLTDLMLAWWSTDWLLHWMIGCCLLNWSIGSFHNHWIALSFNQLQWATTVLLNNDRFCASSIKSIILLSSDQSLRSSLQNSMLKKYNMLFYLPLISLWFLMKISSIRTLRMLSCVEWQKVTI